jgi:hypothetical protein
MILGCSCNLLFHSFYISFLILLLFVDSILLNLVESLLCHLECLELVDVVTIEQDLHVSFISG